MVSVLGVLGSAVWNRFLKFFDFGLSLFFVVLVVAVDQFFDL
jgi:hypothetical protein